MGTVTPMGETLEDTWRNVSGGKSGIGMMELLDTSNLSVHIGGECKSFVPEDYMDKKDARRMDRYMQLAVAAARLAYNHSGLDGADIDRTRFGVSVGSGSGGIRTIESTLMKALDVGFHKISPFFVPMMLTDSGAGRISIEFKAKGPNRAVVTACATGTDSIGDAMRLIRDNEADIMFAGGAESPMTPLAVAGFASARALSTKNDTPQLASRPFDKERDGFVMSEGSGILILEELEHARRRGATIYAEVLGYGASADAHDIVAPCDDGDGASRAMERALADAGISAQEVQYVNAHGTSTPLGDIAETIAIKRVFGDYAKNGLLVSSTKSMHGHLLGAAGALEAIISIEAIRNRLVPPTINLDNQDPECDLDYVANNARKADNLDTAMSNSFGFGGHNASLILREYQE